jgi:quercetin dioxygenase-like cupin family protein
MQHDSDPDTTPRKAVVLSVPFKPGTGDWHAHRRAQLIHASEGVVTVQTNSGHWVVPPRGPADPAGGGGRECTAE